MDRNLKPCPLCGGEADVVMFEHGYMTFNARIECKLCGLSLDWETEYKEYISLSGEKAVIKTSLDPFEAWNRRAEK